jgi:hypothetical protein
MWGNMQLLNNSRNHRKAVAHSFRLSEEWLEILREEASVQGINVNALANKILQNYCRHWRWVERFGALSLTRPTFAEIVACCPEDMLTEIARTFGSTGMKDAFRTKGLLPTHDQVMNFIRNDMGKFGNWFNSTHYTRGRKETLHLRHSVGRKWGVFIAELISATFEQMLNEEVTSEISDGYVTLYITT